MNGIDHVGRSLTRHLATEHDLRVCGAIVTPDSPLRNGRVSEWVLSSDDLRDVDVVYVEGGWVDMAAVEKFPRSAAEEFVFGGGQLIVADVNRSNVMTQVEPLRQASQLFGSAPDMLADGDVAVRYLGDVDAREQYGIRFATEQMWVSESLRPSFEGIDALLGDSVVLLQLGAGQIAASGNATTRVLSLDEYDDRGPVTPWATVNAYGSGHAVLIAGWVSHDLIVEACPDNARWISNLIALLTDWTHESASWTTTHSQSGRAAADLSALLDQAESQKLERKSSFLIPADPSRGDTPIDDIQFQVGKSIVALANTDGGHLIIGQADDLTVLGLEPDLSKVRNGDRDGFEQRLVQYADNFLSPRWEVLGLTLHWVKTPSGDVAIVEIPEQPSDKITSIRKTKRGDDSVYVRRSTRTDRLEGSNLAHWSAARSRRA
ncbi:ATP-binding protein [Gordonia sp. OPL2]|nr:ATP-binding protein [Gordonia sp. OPL2]